MAGAKLDLITIKRIFESELSDLTLNQGKGSNILRLQEALHYRWSSTAISAVLNCQSVEWTVYLELLTDCGHCRFRGKIALLKFND